MLSKEEAESKILKLFYHFELDRVFNITYQSAEIVDFLETTDGVDYREHDWYPSEDGNTLEVELWAKDFEIGLYFLSRSFALINAMDSKLDFLTKRWFRIQASIYAGFFGVWIWNMLMLMYAEFHSIGYLVRTIFTFSLLIGIVIVLVILSRKRKQKIMNLFFENVESISDEIIPDSDEDTNFFSESFQHGLFAVIFNIFGIIVFIMSVLLHSVFGLLY